MLRFVNDHLPVYHHRRDAGGVLVRVVIGGHLRHGVRVEDRDVGPVALFQGAPVHQPQGRCRPTGHLVDGGVQRHQAQITYVVAEDSDEGAVEAGVRLPLAGDTVGRQ